MADALLSQAARDLQACFETAARQHPNLLREGDYLFAGRHVRLRIVGLGLADAVMEPFAHLRCTGVESVPQLAIDLWDEAETGIDAPETSRIIDFNGRQHGFPSGWALSTDMQILGYVQTDGVLVLDRTGGYLVGWRATSRRLSPHERARPLPFVLNVWYNDQDVQILHAGLVARGQQGALLGGAGGVGKSTTTLACLLAGFDVLGDDFVGLSGASSRSFAGLSLYSTARLHIDHLQRFPTLAPFASSTMDEQERKSFLLLARVAPLRLVVRVPIKAILLPRVVDSEQSHLRICTKRDALWTMAPTCVLKVAPANDLGGLARLRHLIDAVPCYWLELGRNLESIPTCVGEALASSAVA